jgi:hypothetical protein
MPEVFYLLACFGLTYLACDASILARPREIIRRRLRFIDKMLACYFCTGFWVSLAWYALLSPLAADWRIGVLGVAHAFAGASFSYALNVVLLRFEVHIEMRVEDERRE